MRITKNRATTIAGAGAVVLLSVAGAAYAASLTVTSSDLGAGRANVGTCQTGTISTSYVPNTDVVNTGGGWTVSSVLLTGVSNACATKTLYVSLGNGTAVLASGSLVVPANSATTPFRVSVTPTTVLAADVTKVDILIPS